MAELDQPVVRWITHSMLLPPESRDVKIAREAREAMEWPLQVLDGELGRRQYLVDPKRSLLPISTSRRFSTGFCSSISRESRISQLGSAMLGPACGEKGASARES